MSFQASYLALLSATHEQMRMTFPSPSLTKSVDEHKQSDADSPDKLPLPSFLPQSTASSSSYTSPPSGLSSTFSSLPSLSSSASPCSSCSQLLPHLSSLHSAFTSYQLHLNSSLLSLSSALERNQLDRASFERSWKRSEVEYRKRITQQLEDAQDDLQTQIDDLRVLASSHQRIASPPPAPSPPSSLEAEVASLQSRLSSALASVQSERDERIRLVQRLDTLEAAVRSAAEEHSQNDARVERAETNVRDLADRATEQIQRERREREYAYERLLRRVEQAESRAQLAERNAAAKVEHAQLDLREWISREEQRRAQRAVNDAAAAALRVREALQRPAEPTTAAPDYPTPAVIQPEHSRTPSVHAHLPPPPSVVSVPHPSDQLAVPTSSSPIGLTPPSGSAVPYNLFVRVWNLPLNPQQRNNPIAALFIPSPQYPTFGPSSLASWTYVSQTEWLRDAPNPVFQQALLWDYEEGQAEVRLSVYVVDEENVRDEDRVGSVIIPTALIVAAANGRAQHSISMPVPIGVSAPANGLTFALRHEDGGKDALLRDVMVMVECEADASTPRPSPAPQPALSLLVACSALPREGAGLPSPICALFVEGADGEWVYVDQTEWLRGVAAPEFQQGMLVEIADVDGGHRRLRLSVYDVDSEEVRDADRVGSADLTVQQLRASLASGIELEMDLSHEEPGKAARLTAIACKLKVQIAQPQATDAAPAGGAVNEMEMSAVKDTAEAEEEEEKEPREHGERDEDDVEVEAVDSASGSTEDSDDEAEEEEEEDEPNTSARSALVPRLAMEVAGIELEISEDDEDVQRELDTQPQDDDDSNDG